MNRVLCPKCQHVLAYHEVRFGKFEVHCRRCKSFYRISVDELGERVDQTQAQPSRMAKLSKPNIVV